MGTRQCVWNKAGVFVTTLHEQQNMYKKKENRTSFLITIISDFCEAVENKGVKNCCMDLISSFVKLTSLQHLL